MITDWRKVQVSKRNVQYSRNFCLPSEHSNASQASFYFQNIYIKFIYDTPKIFISSGLLTSINVFKAQYAGFLRCFFMTSLVLISLSSKHHSVDPESSHAESLQSSRQFSSPALVIINKFRVPSNPQHPRL